MKDILHFPIIFNEQAQYYDAALRDQDKTRSHSQGYPAVRDPAVTENPRRVLPDTLSEADLHKYKLHYGPALIRS